MSKVLYLHGARHVTDTLQTVSLPAFSQVLNNIESGLPRRVEQGQSSAFIQGIRDKIDEIRPLLVNQAVDKNYAKEPKQ